MQMTDSGKTPSMQVNDNVVVWVYLVLATSRDDCSNLIVSGSIIPAQVSVWINSDVGKDIELFT